MKSKRKEKIKYPDFKEINKKCKSKMEEKFDEYGNSWNENIVFDWSWWYKRLQGEVKEIAETNHPITRQEEIIDAINILSMMYQNNKQNVKWHMEDLRMGRHG